MSACLMNDGPSAQAEELLRKVGEQVQPIMRKRQMRVPLLSEFFPRHGNLVSQCLMG